MGTLQKIRLPKAQAKPQLGANKEPTGAKRPIKSRCLINGVAIAQRGQFNWGYTFGVNPQQAKLRISDLYADEMIKQINEKSGRVELEMAGANVDGEETKQVWKGLSLLPRFPDDHTHDIITITDDRWR